MTDHSVRNVIIITDGDKVASHAVQRVAMEVGGRCISRSAGNPTPLQGEEIVNQVMKAAYDPVLVMFDDNGQWEYGDGEKALEYVATHPNIKVLGAIAVASNTDAVEGTHIDLAVDSNGKIVESGVDKDGNIEFSKELRIYGDTVDVLDRLQIPLIIGVGDIGKMNGRDHIRYGAPITRKAVEIILRRSGYDENHKGEE
jgi:stage V sporulation protein AE